MQSLGNLPPGSAAPGVPQVYFCWEAFQPHWGLAAQLTVRSMPPPQKVSSAGLLQHPWGGIPLHTGGSFVSGAKASPAGPVSDTFGRSPCWPSAVGWGLSGAGGVPSAGGGGPSAGGPLSLGGKDASMSCRSSQLRGCMPPGSAPPLVPQVYFFWAAFQPHLGLPVQSTMPMPPLIHQFSTESLQHPWGFMGPHMARVKLLTCGSPGSSPTQAVSPSSPTPNKQKNLRVAMAAAATVSITAWWASDPCLARCQPRTRRSGT